MPVQDRYFSLAAFTSRISGWDDTTDAQDESVGAILDAASRQIDGFCGRSFGKSDEAETRRFLPPLTPWGAVYPFGIGSPPRVEVDDLVSLTAINCDDGSGAFAVAWSLTGVSLSPFNAAQRQEPYTDLMWIGNYVASPAQAFVSYGIEVVGIWGWPAIPGPVSEVCFLLANRMWTMRNAPFGATGSAGARHVPGNELGAVLMATSLTPIFQQMLAPYRKLTV